MGDEPHAAFSPRAHPSNTIVSRTPRQFGRCLSFKGQFLSNPLCFATFAPPLPQVSAWSGVHVTESYALQHTGAELVGGFTRVHLMRDAALGGVAAVHALPAALPPSATRLSFRDALGNISTSSVVRLRTLCFDGACPLAACRPASHRTVVATLDPHPGVCVSGCCVTCLHPPPPRVWR